MVLPVTLAALMMTAAVPGSPAPAVEAAPAAPPGQTAKRTIAATLWPVEPSVAAGFLGSSAGIVPYEGATVFVPIIPGLGPTVVMRGAATDTGRSTYAEGIVGIGAAWEGRLGDMRARVSLVPAAVVTSAHDATRSAVVLNPGVLLPLEVALPLGNGVSFTGFIEPGVSTAVVTVVDNQIDTGRDRLFVLLGAGLTFGGPVD